MSFRSGPSASRQAAEHGLDLSPSRAIINLN
jgi:hypothetical protein